MAIIHKFRKIGSESRHARSERKKIGNQTDNPCVAGRHDREKALKKEWTDYDPSL
jgi:hypothetical protein